MSKFGIACFGFCLGLALMSFVNGNGTAGLIQLIAAAANLQWFFR